MTKKKHSMIRTNLHLTKKIRDDLRTVADRMNAKSEHDAEEETPASVARLALTEWLKGRA